MKYWPRSSCHPRKGRLTLKYLFRRPKIRSQLSVKLTPENGFVVEYSNRAYHIVFYYILFQLKSTVPTCQLVFHNPPKKQLKVCHWVRGAINKASFYSQWHFLDLTPSLWHSIARKVTLFAALDVSRTLFPSLNHYSCAVSSIFTLGILLKHFTKSMIEGHLVAQK